MQAAPVQHQSEHAGPPFLEGRPVTRNKSSAREPVGAANVALGVSFDIAHANLGCSVQWRGTDAVRIRWTRIKREVYREVNVARHYRRFIAGNSTGYRKKSLRTRATEEALWKRPWLSRRFRLRSKHRSAWGSFGYTDSYGTYTPLEDSRAQNLHVWYCGMRIESDRVLWTRKRQIRCGPGCYLVSSPFWCLECR